MEELLQCPGCSDTMRKTVIKDEAGKDYSIDFCVACGGVWLDGGELKKALNAKAKVPMRILNIAPFRDKSEINEIAEGSRRCPRCFKMLDVKEMASINIDMCTECGGIWLDKGEFTQILAKVPSSKDADGKSSIPDYQKVALSNSYRNIPNNYKPENPRAEADVVRALFRLLLH